MGVVRAQTVTEDRASGAQVIEGSLKFNGDTSAQYLKRTLGSGDTKTFTFSYWIKFDQGHTGTRYISTGYSAGGNTYGFYIGENSGRVTFNDTGTNAADYNVRPTAELKDSGWYHLVINLDTTESNSDDRVRIYINGVLQINFNTNTRPAEDATGNMNRSGLELSIGAWNYPAGGGYSDGLEGQLSQFYHIDGQSLDASYFGFTDPLTGTWRPKKFDINKAPTASWGTNGFYLPLDGSTADANGLGQDYSGNGNDFSARGSWRQHTQRISKATGALPILDTANAGKTALPTVRGSVGVAVTVAGKTGGGNAYYLDGVEAKTLGFVRGQTVTFDTSDSTVGGHPFRLSGVSNGAHAADYRSVLFDGTGDYLVSASSTDYAFGTGDFTFEFWIYIESYPSGDLYAIASFTDDKNNIDIDGDGHLNYYDGTSYDTGNVVPLNEWTHVAYSKSGTAVRIFLNGTNIYTVTSSVDVGSSARQFNIGMRYDGSQNSLNGYLSDYRVVKGTAVYTENFTPPTTSLTNITNTKLLCCNNSSVTGTTTGTVTSSGDPTSSTTNPYDTYPFATVTSISEGSVGAATTITIPHNAPDDLYYYCTAHSGMGGAIGLSTDIQVADPYAWKNTLALTGNSNYDRSNLVNCKNSLKALTFNGNMYASNGLAGNGTFSNFYGQSFKFDGSGDYIAVASSADCSKMGTGDFTFEAWVNMTNLSNRGTWFDTRASGDTVGLTFGHETSGAVRVYMNASGGSDIVVQQSTACLVKRWYHMAVTRESGTVRLFINGQNVSSGTRTSDLNNTNAVNIGYRTYTSSSFDYFTGYMNDARIYKGLAKYTENFYPASTDPAITIDSPSGVAYSSALTKPSGGSVIFERTGSFLNFPSYVDSGQLKPGAGDFTIECFLYVKTFANYPVIVDTRISGSGDAAGFFWGLNDTGKIYLYTDSGTRIDFDFIPKKQWTHVALTRASNVFKMFVNGQKATSTYTDTQDYSNPIRYIGESPNSESQTWFMDASISNFRFTKGTSLYNATFQPPTEPLTAHANTEILCCQNPDDPEVSAACMTGASLTANSVPTPSSTAPTGLTGSVEFDGTDDHLYVAGTVASAIVNWKSTAYTIEYWINADAFGGSGNSKSNVVGNSILATSSEWWSFGPKADGEVMFYYWKGSQQDFLSGTTLNTGTWYHLAFVHDGSNNLAIYVDGDRKATATISGTPQVSSADDQNNSDGVFGIGKVAGGSFNGKISNLRISKRAVYITNFTPPSKDLGADPNTTLLCCQDPSDDTTSAAVTMPVIATNSVSTPINPFDNDDDFAQGKSSGYCILNSVDQHSGTFSQGALRFTNSGEANVSGTLAMPRNSGKYYWEVYGEDVSGGVIGIGAYSVNQISALASIYGPFYGYSPNGNKYINTTSFNSNSITSSSSSYGETWTTGDMISVLFDTDANELTFWKNGATQGVAYVVNREHDYFPQVHCNDTELLFNFGQNPFMFVPPDGYKTLNTSNIPTPEILRSDQSVGVTTYVGNATQRNITGYNFQPDLVWVKARDATHYWMMTDSVRGASKAIYTNDDTNEQTDTSKINGFNFNGFATGTDTDANANTKNFTAMCFKAGGNKNTFNIDDVGYSSAAAANMSAGALNSSTMNQTQTWSGLFSSGLFDQAITNAFNGHISETTRARTSGNAVLITMTLSTPVTVSSEITVFAETNYSSTCVVTLDGITHTSPINDVHTFKVSGSLTKMTLVSNNGSGRTYFEGMTIDGKLLVDNGVSINKPSLAATGASVGTKQGFSIIKYEGDGNSTTSIAHGLGKTPSWIMIKRLDGGSGNTGDWMGGHAHMSSWKNYMVPNKNQNQYDDFQPFAAYPTDTVFTVGSSDRVNNDGNDYVAYVWADIPGVQKFGIYNGNGNANGPFINTGFRPAIIWYKDRTSGGYWNIRDSKRTPYNGIAQELYTAESDVENHHNTRNVDFLSNGFKIKDSHDAINNSARQYIYMAWAEASQFNLYGGQANAR